MVYTANNLVTDAFYISGIVSREFETVSGQQSQVGLNVLNDILTDKAIEKDMIPYYTKYTFNAVAGQESYFIPNLEELDTLVFFLSDVRYQMRQVDRVQYRGSSRANNVTSLPFNWNLERCTGGALLSMYFFPNQNYPIEAWGLFRLNEVTQFQDLSLNVPVAQLGLVSIFGTAPAAGILTAGQLVINGVDLEGIYNTPLILVNHINTGIIPGITATLVSNQLTLTGSVEQSSIAVTTSGDVDPLSGLSFANFSLTTGSQSATFTPTGLDRFYTSYLKFSVADRLCTEYNFLVPPGVSKQLLQYQRWISKRSGGLDLNMQKTSTLKNQSVFNYATVNLGRGWTP